MRHPARPQQLVEHALESSRSEHCVAIVHDTTGYLYNPAHRWHYYRDMRPDEVLVFKAHDRSVVAGATDSGAIVLSKDADLNAPLGIGNDG